jgi:hypothetical protein
LASKYEKGEMSWAAYHREVMLRAIGERFPRRRRVRAATRDATTDNGATAWSEQELALALGPQITWWRNGLYAAKIGSFVALPAVTYDAYQSFRTGFFGMPFHSNSGLFDLMLWVASEALQWLVASFTLGALWPSLLGRRGVHKGLALGAVIVAAAGTETLVSRAFGQPGAFDLATRAVLILGYLGALGVMLDVFTLKKVDRDRWEFVNYLRLRETRWLAAYGATSLLVIGSIVHQIRSGEPLTNLPTTLISDVIAGGHR